MRGTAPRKDFAMTYAIMGAMPEEVDQLCSPPV